MRTNFLDGGASGLIAQQSDSRTPETVEHGRAASPQRLHRGVRNGLEVGNAGLGPLPCKQQAHGCHPEVAGLSRSVEDRSLTPYALPIDQGGCVDVGPGVQQTLYYFSLNEFCSYMRQSRAFQDEHSPGSGPDIECRIPPMQNRTFLMQEFFRGFSVATDRREYTRLVVLGLTTGLFPYRDRRVGTRPVSRCLLLGWSLALRHLHASGVCTRIRALDIFFVFWRTIDLMMKSNNAVSIRLHFEEVQ